MSCDKCFNGDKTTIQFMTSGFTAEYIQIGGPEITREVVDATVLGPASCRSKCPGDRIDYGEAALQFCFDPDVQPPFNGPSETVIITWPPKPGQTNGATLTGTGFIRRFKLPDAQPDTRMEAEADLVYDCGSVPAFAPGS